MLNLLIVVAEMSQEVLSQHTQAKNIIHEISLYCSAYCRDPHKRAYILRPLRLKFSITFWQNSLRSKIYDKRKHNCYKYTIFECLYQTHPPPSFIYGLQRQNIWAFNRLSPKNEGSFMRVSTVLLNERNAPRSSRILSNNIYLKLFYWDWNHTDCYQKAPQFYLLSTLLL